MHLIQKIEERVEVKLVFEHGLDFGIDPLDPPSDCESEAPKSHMFQAVGDPLYVLARKAQTQLKNGLYFLDTGPTTLGPFRK